MTIDLFRVSGSLRVPGLGLLLLPAPPVPAWLLQGALHTPLAVQLHRPGLPPLALPASVEEVAPAGQLPTRALLLDADPGPVLPGAHVRLLNIDPLELLAPPAPR